MLTIIPPNNSCYHMWKKGVVKERILHLVLASVVVTDDVINLDTLIVLKTVEQPYRNHNGGAFTWFG